MECTGARLLARPEELSACHWIGEDTTSHLRLHVPLGSAFSLPGPVEPATALLVRIELGLDEAAEVGTLSLRQSCNGANGLALAATDARTAGVGTVISSADALAIQVLGAVGHGTGPLADDSPLVGGEDVVIHEAAGCAHVLGSVHLEQAVVKDFVVMSVHHDIVEAVSSAHEAIP